MLVYLLRHGDAIESATLHDSERPLSGIGNKQAVTVGTFLKSLNIHPDRIISSPLVRAQQTAEHVRALLNLAAVHTSEYLIPGTRKQQLIDMLNEGQVNSVLLVGHEPHLSQTISFLLTEHENLQVDMRKCSLGCLLASSPARKGHAMLQWLLTVEQMGMLLYQGPSH